MSLFRPPAAANPDDARVGALLHRVLSIGAVLALLGGVHAALFGVDPTIPFVYLAAGLSMAILWGVLHTGSIRLVARALVVVGFVLVWGAAWATQGVHASTAAVAVLLVMLSGLVWSERAAVVTAVASAVALLALHLGEREGWLAGASVDVGHAVVSNLIATGMAAVVILMSLGEVRQREQIEHHRALREAARREAAESRLRHTQRLEAIAQVAHRVMHDLNNNLTVIAGNLALMESTSDPESLDDARAAVDRGVGIARRLLAFSAAAPSRAGEVRIDEVIQSLQPLLESTLGSRRNLELTVDGHLPTTVLDRGTLETALVHLTVNAREAMSEGGCLCIAVSSSQQESIATVLIEVHDTGAGMPDTVRARATEPFFTTKESGTGLGLAMVADFVERAGGTLAVQSEVGRGTVISIRLPAKQHTPREADSPHERSEDGELRRTVLVVEDDDAVRRITVRMLERLGYETWEAATSQDALDAVAHQCPALVLTDIGLRGASGVALVEALRERWPDLQVVFASGRHRGDVSGIEERDGWLGKPFGTRELEAAVRAQLGEPGGTIA